MMIRLRSKLFVSRPSRLKKCSLYVHDQSPLSYDVASGLLNVSHPDYRIYARHKSVSPCNELPAVAEVICSSVQPGEHEGQSFKEEMHVRKRADKELPRVNNRVKK